MSAGLNLNLSWLPVAPPEFSQQSRAIASAPDKVGRDIRRLANHSLDLNQLVRLAKSIQSARAAGKSLKPLSPLKLGVLSNSTVDFLLPAMVASAARHGVDLTCISGHFDQALQESLDPESDVNRAEPDAVLIAVDYRGLPFSPSAGNADAAADTVKNCLGYIQTIRSAIKKNCKAICILQTLAAPPEALFGSLDRVLAGTTRWFVDTFNRALADSVLGTEDILLDVAAIAEAVGTEEWHCPRQWNIGKFPFSESCIPLYADHVGRLLGAMRGKSRRCLILDLDNTVWGGVIGDDGLDGIKLAQGDATGEAHLALQRLALELRGRGVVLAVSSKNEDETARLPFRKHPEMLLKEDHIAVFQANWNDKATNIKAIAEELSLGLESMVFVDDNPVERGLVREILPEVAVPEMPEDPAHYARTLAAAGYFEAIAFSSEDVKRADFYQDNARRVALQQQAGDIEGYLASLNMQITFSPFDATGRTRITQLINKSNQYNLTTRRYTEADVAGAESDASCFTLQVRLADTFGDNGMISVVICRESGARTWEIDTWLMSCRVLGRRVENMVLREILAQAAQRDIETLVGRFIPTDRNKLVVDHYKKLGFALVEETPAGETTWEMPVNGAQVESAPMAVIHTGFDYAGITSA